MPVDMERDQSAERRQRHDAEDEQHLAQHAELGIEQDDHQAQNQAEDQREARLGALLVLEIAAPFDAVFLAIERYLLRDRLLAPPPAATAGRGRW